MAALARLRDFTYTADARSVAAVGQGAANALAANGIEPVVLAVPLSIMEAAAGYLAGSLVTTDERV